MAAMKIFDALWWGNHFWLGILCGALVVMAVAIIADRRRQKRRNIENVGFMPWTGITVLATLIALVSAALAIKIG